MGPAEPFSLSEVNRVDDPHPLKIAAVITNRNVHFIKFITEIYTNAEKKQGAISCSPENPTVSGFYQPIKIPQRVYSYQHVHRYVNI